MGSARFTYKLNIFYEIIANPLLFISMHYNYAMTLNELNGNDLDLNIQMAKSSDTSTQMQQQLFALKEEAVREALAQNPSLDRRIASQMEAKYGDVIASHIAIDDTLFERYFDERPAALAQNPSLTKNMQQKVYCLTNDVQAALASNVNAEYTIMMLLYETNKPEVLASLAANPSSPAEILCKMGWNKRWHLSLAGNPGSPAELLEELSTSEDSEVLAALAQNKGTLS